MQFLKNGRWNVQNAAFCAVCPDDRAIWRGTRLWHLGAYLRLQYAPMALCWQLLYCGPLTRAIFRLVFRRGEKQTD